MSLMACEIRDYFERTDGGDFFVAGRNQPFSVLPPRSDTDTVLFFSKTTPYARLCQTLGDELRYAAVARGCLPFEEEVDWMRQFVGERRFLFLGDADPVDLLMFAWLQQRLPIEHAGLTDELLRATGTPFEDHLTIKLNQQEINALPLVERFLSDLTGLIGPWCAGLLSTGRKVEVEAMLSCSTCSPAGMQNALLAGDDE